ncbi:MAG: hypothetical protein V3T17_06620, partial [Pseudomonadales bacterium]
HLKSTVYVFDDSGVSDLETFLECNRQELVEKEFKDLRQLINLQVIPAKRDVTSSDDSSSKKPLSAITTNFFNRENELSNDDLSKINELVLGMDKELGERYESFFKDFLFGDNDGDRSYCLK